MVDQYLCCPECHALLDSSAVEGESRCAGCGYRYAVYDGMVDFAPDNHFYWGEVSQERMERVNRRALTEGWFEAFFKEIVGANQRDMARYLLDPIRVAGMFHFYNPRKNQVCVDLGSGWGPISFGLSKYYDTVYSMDGVYERLRFQSIRAQQEGVDNIRILKGSLLKLPLPDHTADTVIVNGLLEWIGLSDEVTSPRELQLRFLREVRRVLKPDGKLFIGIENRTGAQFFLGSRDHSGLRYTSLMPRWMADRVVRRARRLDDASYFDGARQNYRTLTYTYWGYRKLLKEAGFVQPEMYWTWPSYNEPRVSGTLDGRSGAFYLDQVEGEVHDGLRRAIVSAARHLPGPVLSMLIKVFAPHFLILTGKDRNADGLQQDALGSKPRGGVLRSTPHTERNLDTDYLVLGRKGMNRVVSVTQEAGSFGPRFQIQTEDGNEGGRPMHRHDPKEVRAAGIWLSQFQRETDLGELSADQAQRELGRLVDSTRRFTGDLSGLLVDYAQLFKAEVGIGMRGVKEHGNFTPQNVYIRPDGRVRVINWHDSRPDGSPLMDVGAMMLALMEEPDGLAEFLGAYGEAPALRLAPAYYILRLLEREFNPEAEDAEIYLGRVYWVPKLKMALAWAVAERGAPIAEPG